MSIENASAFIERIKSDKMLQERIKAISESSEAMSEIIRVAEEAGFAFTAENYQAAVKEYVKQNHDERKPSGESDEPWGVIESISWLFDL